MAKASKKTKNRSTATAKQENILTKIGRFARRNKALVFAVIIAVMCGGWYTYRSFAAGHVAAYEAAKLDPSPVTEQKTSTGKANASVARISSGQSLVWQIPGNKLKSGRIHKVCAVARKESPTNNPILNIRVQQVMGARISSGFDKSWSMPVFLQDSYTRYCSYAFKGWGRDATKMTFTNRGPGEIRISLLVVE